MNSYLVEYICRDGNKYRHETEEVLAFSARDAIERVREEHGTESDFRIERVFKDYRDSWREVEFY